MARVRGEGDWEGDAMGEDERRTLRQFLASIFFPFLTKGGGSIGFSLARREIAVAPGL